MSKMSLVQRLNEAEARRHKGRLAEIAKHANKLRLFEPTFDALAVQGLPVSLGWSLYATQNALRVTLGSTTSYDHRLYSALIEMGFVEQRDQRIGNIYTTTFLKKGRLTVAVTVEHSALDDKPRPVQTSAQQPAEASCL